MEIDRILYPVETLGPGKRVVIWTIGCPHRCKGCSNPELWSSDSLKDIEIEDIMDFINNITEPVDGVTITGGEPFAQRKHLNILLTSLRDSGIDDILVYTGYEMDEIINECCEQLSKIDVIITGKYVDKLNDNIGLRGSSNQQIIVLTKEMVEKYSGAEKCLRASKNFLFKGNIVSVGIPIKSE